MAATAICTAVAVACGSSHDAPPPCNPNTTPVLASSYDQSCTQDADCIAVPEPRATCSCTWCIDNAINKKDYARFQQDVARVAGPDPGPPTPFGCYCPLMGKGRCEAGMCTATYPPPQCDGSPKPDAPGMFGCN